MERMPSSRSEGGKYFRFFAARPVRGALAPSAGGTVFLGGVWGVASAVAHGDDALEAERLEQGRPRLAG